MSVVVPAHALFWLLIVAQTVLLTVLLLERRRRRRSESTVQRQYAEITHAARLALVGEITASIAHEVAQPLSAILNNIETAVTLLKQPHPDLVLLHEILADVRTDDLRANNIVRKLRVLLQKRELQFDRVDINAQVASVVSMVSAHAERLGVVITTDLDLELPVVRADHVHLQQVLLNLMINALESMEATPRVPRRLQIRTTQYNNTHAQVAVIDSGNGVETRQISKLFDSFFTTKEQGLGLGLSIARSIVLQHGGTIWAANAPYGGAAFFFTVPMCTIGSRELQHDVPSTIMGNLSEHNAPLH
jgi:C4-dicarboxylate-specific signal transduction histidine kinase